eukprot:1161171-Pelagomonas_calceolata.AAC.2
MALLLLLRFRPRPPLLGSSSSGAAGEPILSRPPELLRCSEGCKKARNVKETHVAAWGRGNKAGGGP